MTPCPLCTANSGIHDFQQTCWMRLYGRASAAALPAVGAEVLGFGAEQ